MGAVSVCGSKERISLLEPSWGSPVEASAVDVGKADIVPTQSVSDHAFLDKSRTSTEEVIQSGDPVFAIGELRRGMAPLAGLPETSCQLAKYGGVLLVSGSTERAVKVLYVVWLVVHVLLGLLCWAALAFGAWAHISSYPPTEGSSVRTFFDSLRTTPLKSEPGHDHPLWDRGENDQDAPKPPKAEDGLSPPPA